MELLFSKINGTNPHLNYEALKESIIAKLSPTCDKAEVFILNNFPAPVSAQVDIDFIILLNIPKLHRSWYQVDLETDKVSVKNQIIAVSVINEFLDSEIIVKDNYLEIDENYLSFDDLASKLKWGLVNYLANNCGLTRNKITVHPFFWIKNNKNNGVTSNTLIGNHFTYQNVEEVIKRNYYFKWQGYSDWNDKGSFGESIMAIFEQASRDSETGYITKRKIERMQSRFEEASQKAYSSIGECLVEISGKAGTGKSSDLLKFMLNNSINGKKGIFLTYNHLLVFDISSQIKSFTNQLPEEKRQFKQSTSTDTIHGFFYHIAKKLAVLILMSEERINELTNKLDTRLKTIENYFDSIRISEPEISLAKLLYYVQSKFEADKGTKIEAINLLRHIDHYRFLSDKKTTSHWIKLYRDDTVSKLSQLISSQIFIKDYHAVLKRIRQATINLSAFLEDLDVVNKYSLISEALNLESDILEGNGSTKIDLEKLKKRYRRGLGGFRSGRTLYVDEGQDCHKYERDIFINIFGSKNIVIANGDKEQLIRYSEICNWHISQNKAIEYYRYAKKRKSFRMKPAIAILANYIADFYGIDLNIEPIDTEDHGNIILAFNPEREKQIESINTLYEKGKIQGCTAYESLLLMNVSKKLNSGDSLQEESSVVMNEYDNILKEKESKKEDWKLISAAEPLMTDFRFWNATGNVKKREMSDPGALSVRTIYYESCRGIEAWSIMCFNFDRFFDLKSMERTADSFLLDNILLTTEERRNMYAATWALMAITRAMENCYIELNDLNSPISKCILNFAEKYPNYVTYLN